MIGTVQDITERRQTEEREKQLEQELNLAGSTEGMTGATAPRLKRNY